MHTVCRFVVRVKDAARYEAVVKCYGVGANRVRPRAVTDRPYDFPS